jgi:hypothetical protein
MFPVRLGTKFVDDRGLRCGVRLVHRRWLCWAVLEPMATAIAIAVLGVHVHRTSEVRPIGDGQPGGHDVALQRRRFHKDHPLSRRYVAANRALDRGDSCKDPGRDLPAGSDGQGVLDIDLALDATFNGEIARGG